MAKLPYDMLAPLLWPNGARSNVWAVLDCARDERVWSTLQATTLPRQCLYAGALHPSLERAAPFLVQLQFGELQTMRVLNRAWGQSWGILLTAGTSLTALRAHLRKFVRVTGPQGKPLVFRYYDPRVMRVFLPTCSSVQLKDLFGPNIECIATEDDSSPAQLIEFRLDAERRLQRSVVSLASDGIL